MNHDLDPRLREKLMEYNRPPEVPRERIWEAIQARRRAEDPAAPMRVPSRSVGLMRRLAWPLAAAALLVLGIGLGRMSKDAGPMQDTPTGTTVAHPSPPPEQANLYSLAAERYLGRAEILLTRYRNNEHEQNGEDGFQTWAGQLLLETRLLLDSPAGDDPDTHRLLEDLELVLARMTRLGPGENGDRRILDESLDNGTLIMRLRTRKPAAKLPNGA
jgi:hypothetical protein